MNTEDGLVRNADSLSTPSMLQIEHAIMLHHLTSSTTISDRLESAVEQLRNDGLRRRPETRICMRLLYRLPVGQPAIFRSVIVVEEDDSDDEWSREYST